MKKKTLASGSEKFRNVRNSVEIAWTNTQKSDLWRHIAKILLTKQRKQEKADNILSNRIAAIKNYQKTRSVLGRKRPEQISEVWKINKPNNFGQIPLEQQSEQFNSGSIL